MGRHIIRGRWPLPPAGRSPYVEPRYHEGGEVRVVLDASPKERTPLDVRELILPKAAPGTVGLCRLRRAPHRMTGRARPKW